MCRDQNPCVPQAGVANGASGDQGSERRKSVLSVACDTLLIAVAMYMTIQLMANLVTILTIIPRQETTVRMVQLLGSAIVQGGMVIWWWFMLMSACSWTWYPVTPRIRRWYGLVWFLFVAGVLIHASLHLTEYGFAWRRFRTLPYFEYFVFMASYTIAAAPIVLLGIGYIGLARRRFRSYCRTGK